MFSELLPDVAATHALAARLAAELRPGDVLALVGDLGAGKTEFTRGLGLALGLPPEVAVCSPSYLLLNLYDGGRLPLAHVDAYFMEGPDDLERAGLADLLADGWVMVVEWAERVAEALPAHTRWIQLSPGPQPESRLATLGGPELAETMEAL
ncbi:MAG: tRNA threonylcarbamoyladenosine biosynthesis protein TsaE [Pseudohongiellaceae bacterium]|jgi:tRNA threonylcarbamoyladenosine biosynthesis protein TsaE